jgi:mono/diheme cytochrome c family protein
MRRPSTRPAGALAAVLLLALATLGASGAFADDGAVLYEKNCSKCHGADGRADTPVGKAMKVVSLAEPKWAGEDTADALVSAFRANPKHKAVASKVTDDDLRTISVHIRTLASSQP